MRNLVLQVRNSKSLYCNRVCNNNLIETAQGPSDEIWTFLNKDCNKALIQKAILGGGAGFLWGRLPGLECIASACFQSQGYGPEKERMFIPFPKKNSYSGSGVSFDRPRWWAWSSSKGGAFFPGWFSTTSFDQFGCR